MIDKCPRIIVRCANAAGTLAWRWPSRERTTCLSRFEVAEHNGAGLATCDDGMVIEITTMKGVADLLFRVNRAEPGCSQSM